MALFDQHGWDAADQGLYAHIRRKTRSPICQFSTSCGRAFADRVAALEEALARVKTLQGMLPICAWCKKIRSDGDYWQQVDTYITAHTDAQFSHSICPECHEKHVVPQLAQLRQARTT